MKALTKPLKPMRLLLVDDDDATLTLMTDLLIGSNYEVQTARDGDEAIYYLDNGDFDVVVSDMTMPRVDGVALCRRYHEEIPIIVISTCLEAFTTRKIEQYCHCILHKKNLSDHLIQAIDRAQERFSFVELDNNMMTS